MESQTLMGRLDAAVAEVRRHCDLSPRVGIVLGTGLGRLADEISGACAVPYSTVPGFVLPTVESHEGRLILGTLSGVPVAGLQGRLHRYEGHTLPQVVFPVRVLRRLGADVLILTGACGGLVPEWSEGDLVLLEDHINLMGDNPLIGPNEDELGPRFPDMSEPYDAGLRSKAKDAAGRLGITLREGVYAAVTGPNLETRAEYRMLRGLGADVVGMSTVPEVIAARHSGMRVLAVSIVTDLCDPDHLEVADIARIIDNARAAEPHLTRLIGSVVERLHQG
jgi:purine-nucleoside phosphorylase